VYVDTGPVYFDQRSSQSAAALLVLDWFCFFCMFVAKIISNDITSWTTFFKFRCKSCLPVTVYYLSMVVI
jgi:hypothetical protein